MVWWVFVGLVFPRSERPTGSLVDPSELGIALSHPRLNRTLAEKGRPGRSNAALTHRCTVLTCSGRPRGVGEHEVPTGVDALAAPPLRRLLRRLLPQGRQTKRSQVHAALLVGLGRSQHQHAAGTPASGCGARSRTHGRNRHPTSTSPGVRRVAALRARRAPAADTPDTAHAPVGRREYHYMTASRRPINSFRDILKPDVPASYEQGLPGRPRIRNPQRC